MAVDPRYHQMSPLQRPAQFMRLPIDQRVQLLQQLQPGERTEVENTLLQRFLDPQHPDRILQRQQQAAAAQQQRQQSPGMLRQLYDALNAAFQASPGPILEREAFDYAQQQLPGYKQGR